MLAFVSVKFEHCSFHLRHYFGLQICKHSGCIMLCPGLHRLWFFQETSKVLQLWPMFSRGMDWHQQVLPKKLGRKRMVLTPLRRRNVVFSRQQKQFGPTSPRCVPKACPAGVVARRRKSSWMQPLARRTVRKMSALRRVYTLILRVAITIAKAG